MQLKIRMARIMKARALPYDEHPSGLPAGDAARLCEVKVALLSSLRHGGTVELAILLGRGLTELGVDVRAVCADDAIAQRFRDSGVKPYVIPLKRTLDPINAARMRAVFATVDVVHAHDRRTALWMRLLPRPTRRPLTVYTVHGIADEYLPPPVGRSRHTVSETLKYEVLDAGLARRTDLLVSTSRAVGADLVGRLRYPTRRWVLVPNGVDLRDMPFREFRPDGIVASLAIFRAVKGLDVYLRAVAEVMPRHPHVRFAMFGEGEEQQALRTLAGELGVESRLEWPGHVRAPRALDQMRLYVMSSHWENCSLALLEAMATGVPVIATRAWGNAEVATDDVAQVVPPGHHQALAAAIDKLLQSPEQARVQALAARRHVENNFSLTNQATRMLAVYHEALGQKRR